jgi:hypothetical protein
MIQITSRLSLDKNGIYYCSVVGSCRIEDYGWKESNGPRRDMRAVVCRVRVNAVVLLSLRNLFRFCFITVMYFEKWGVLLMNIVDFPVTRRSLQPKRKCEKKIIVHMSASLNERRKAETTISDPADKMAAT